MSNGGGERPVVEKVCGEEVVGGQICFYGNFHVDGAEIVAR